MPRKQDPLSIEYLLLGLIDRQPIHPYDLHKLLITDPELKTLWHFNQSQLYATLVKIERNGLITSEVMTHGNAPKRKVYSLTPEGKQQYEAWLYAPVEHINAFRSDFLARLYFLQQLPPEDFRRCIIEQLDACKRIEERLAKQKEAADSRYLRMIYEYRIYTVKAAGAWLYDLLN